MKSVWIKKLDNNAIIPEQQSIGSAGFDLVATNIKSFTDVEVLENGDICIKPFGRIILGCGFSLSMSKGIEFQIRPRSGMAAKQGLTVLNSPGTIDSDYRREIGVILVNLSNSPQFIKLNTRIAQGVFSKYESPTFVIKDELPDTARGNGGFGSTNN